ncbi:MAG: hypothetical protein JSV71_04180 [Nitrospiraceae bacterium]|nr:MAG: hypothetical protein EP227_06015 [bacterium]UCF86690.1 MAG: hypothetical protein JSV71_04180 [Nitrospiraceae bacterium]
MKEVTTDILKNLHEMANEAEDCISLIQIAFIYNNAQPLGNYKDTVGAIKKEEDHMTKAITEYAADNPELKPYVSVSIHLLRVWDGIGKLLDLIDKKIRDNILFSDKAVNETTFLLQRLIEMLRPTADIILARNTYLSLYIKESQAGVQRRAVDYATLHENRLIEGVCLPAASSVYVNMLDAIKSIAWHTKEIAAKLGE